MTLPTKEILVNHSTEYQDAFESCEAIINSVEALSTRYQELLAPDAIILANTIRQLGGNPFDRARRTMKSQLITVAVCGGFSSGKSFLISAIVNRLAWYTRPSTVDSLFANDTQDAYATFLPTAPEQTNSCPLDIIPAPDGTRSRFEVLFEDTEQWELIGGGNASDDELSRMMLAYATDIEHWRSTRPATHRARKVLRARLHVANMPIPAVIHDLPGIGGAGELHQATVQEALKSADCIVYVASAIKELTEAELCLLRVVEEISDIRSTPVFFILSQKDREQEWQSVQRKNNQFLNEYFRRDGKPNQLLIGEGFIPVSAADEAKAKGWFDSGRFDDAKLSRAIEQSGMAHFRRLLLTHLNQNSGPAHLREIVLQMQRVFKGLRQHINQTTQTTSLPVEEANERIQKSKDLVRAITEKKQQLVQQLEELAKTTKLAAFLDTSDTHFQVVLRREVEPLIASVDLTRASERDKIQQLMKQVRDSWLNRSEKGFFATWGKAWKEYLRHTVILLHERLADAAKEAAITYPEIHHDGEQLQFDEVGISAKDALEVFKIAWQMSAGLSTFGAGALAGSVFIGGTAVALGPIGVFLLASGVLGLGLSRIKKQTDLQRIRKQFIEYLPVYSRGVCEILERQVDEDFERHRGIVVAVISELIGIQEDQIATLQHRLEAGDLVVNRNRIERLEAIAADCKRIEQAIATFFTKVQVNASRS